MLEENEKIKEIEEMIRTGEVRGERKDILIGRGEESLGRAGERVYIREERKEGYQSSNTEGIENILRGECIKTLKGHSHYV